MIVCMNGHHDWDELMISGSSGEVDVGRSGRVSPPACCD